MYGNKFGEWRIFQTNLRVPMVGMVPTPQSLFSVLIHRVVGHDLVSVYVVLTTTLVVRCHLRCWLFAFKTCCLHHIPLSQVFQNHIWEITAKHVYFGPLLATVPTICQDKNNQNCPPAPKAHWLTRFILFCNLYDCITAHVADPFLTFITENETHCVKKRILIFGKVTETNNNVRSMYILTHQHPYNHIKFATNTHTELEKHLKNTLQTLAVSICISA